METSEFEYVGWTLFVVDRQHATQVEAMAEVMRLVHVLNDSSERMRDLGLCLSSRDRLFLKAYSEREVFVESDYGQWFDFKICDASKGEGVEIGQSDGEFVDAVFGLVSHVFDMMERVSTMYRTVRRPSGTSVWFGFLIEDGEE